MNNRIITLFEEENYPKQEFTFNLLQFSFFQSVKNCCFNLRSLKKENEICGFNTNCGNKENSVFFKTWQNEFFLWQTKCFVSLDERLGTKSVREMGQ